MRKKTVWKKRILCWENKLLPLSLTVSFLANLLLFYLGLAYVENPVRQYGYVLLSGLFFLLCVAVFCLERKSLQLPAWKYGIFALWLAYFAGSMLLSWFRFDSFSFVISSAKQFVIMGVAAFLAGILAARKRQGTETFFTLESISLFVIPAALIYLCGALFNCAGFPRRQLGVIGYMNLGYGFAPFLIAHMMRLTEAAEWKLPFSGRVLPHANWLRGVFILVYWMVIMATGTRGCYVAVLAVALFGIIYRLLRREKVGRLALSCLALVLIMLFLMLVYCPVGMQEGVSRMSNSIENWEQGNMVSTKTEFDVSDYGLTEEQFVQMVVEADDNRRITRRPEDMILAPDEVDFVITPETIADINFSLGERSLMYRIALAEFLDHPLLGLGMGGYYYKYSLYPHNAMLEALAETGAFGLAIVLLILYCLVKLFVLGLKRPGAAQVMTLLVLYLTQYMLSGSLWNCAPLQMAVAFSLSLSWTEEPERIRKQDGV